jgi:nucleotidyltransferase/DNA polymerase involved in DNA repair
MYLDQFIAAVELLRHPELRGRPVVVGGDGDPGKRGVVSTASYEARAYGIRSGMPLRRCPEAVFFPVDSSAYLAASARVMDTIRTFPAGVQVVGWDEAFMAVEADDPEAMAREVQRAVHETTALWCSIGVGDNKLRAKLATSFTKPAGVFRMTRKNWEAMMGGLPTDALGHRGQDRPEVSCQGDQNRGRARRGRRRGAGAEPRPTYRAVAPAARDGRGAPFEWKFTRQDLRKLMAGLEEKELPSAA